MKIVTDYKNVILEITNNAEWVDNGIRCDNHILAVPKENNNFVGELPLIFDVSNVPQEVLPYKHCYDGTNFTLNPSYIEPVDPYQEIARLKAQVELQDSAIMDLANIVSELSGGAV